MNREYFINKVLNGEQVSVEEVVKTQAETELKLIQVEAARRIEEENQRQRDALKRQTSITEMVSLSEQAALINREREENERRKNEVLHEFAERELQIREKYYQTYSQFNSLYYSVSKSPYDRRSPSNPLSQELRDRGADLDHLDIEISRIQLSPLAQSLLRKKM